MSDKGLPSALVNVAWILGDKVGRIAVGVLVTGRIAATLGPEQYGTLALCMSLLALSLIVVQFGTDKATLIELSQDGRSDGERLSVIGTALLGRAAIGAVFGLGLLAAGLALGQGHEFHLLLFILALVPLLQSAEVLDLWFASRSESRYSTWGRQMALASATILRVGLLLAGADLIWFVAAIAFESLLVAGLLLLFARRRGGLGRLRARSDIARRLLDNSWPFLVSAVFVYAYSRFDQLLVEALLGREALGHYAAVLTMSTPTLYVIPMAICTSLVPHVSAQRSTDGSEFRMLFAVVAWTSLAAVLMIVAAAPVLVPLVFGHQYVDAVPVLQWHALGLMGAGLGLVQSYWLSAMGKSQAMIAKTAIGAVIGLLGNLLLLPRYGIVGAAWSAVLAETLSALALPLIYRRTLGRTLWAGLTTSPTALVRTVLHSRRSLHR